MKNCNSHEVTTLDLAKHKWELVTEEVLYNVEDNPTQKLRSHKNGKSTVFMKKLRIIVKSLSQSHELSLRTH